MNYNEDIMIRVRVAREMRDEFKAVATKNNTSMSDLIRGWITEYVATTNNNNDVATKNAVVTDDIMGRNQVGQVVATTKIELRKGSFLNIYYKNQPISKKYYVATKDNIELAKDVTVRRLSE